MDQAAGFGIPEWLPPTARRNLAVESQREAREAREAERERQSRIETSHDRALAACRSAAEARGEEVGALAMVTGAGLGRSLDEIFADAAAAGDRTDAREAARMRANGEAEQIHVMFDEPVIRSAPLTPRGRYVRNLLRRFRAEHPGADVIERALFAREARKSWRA